MLIKINAVNFCVRDSSRTVETIGSIYDSPAAWRYSRMADRHRPEHNDCEGNIGVTQRHDYPNDNMVSLNQVQNGMTTHRTDDVGSHPLNSLRPALLSDSNVYGMPFRAKCKHL